MNLEHIAVYLPYNLNTEYCLGDVLNSTSTEKRTKILVPESVDFVLKFCKPILKPKTYLYELKDEICMRWCGGVPEKARPEVIKNIIENMECSAYDSLSYREINFMAENHIDIFGLLYEDLAVLK